MAYHTTKPHSSGTTTDIVTYRYEGKLVYVPVAPTYIQALSHARDAFPQLNGLQDASLSLSLAAPVHGQKFIGISPPAWPRLIAHMSRYQVIDVHTTLMAVHAHGYAVPIPDITITYADADEREETGPAPPYRGPVVVDDDEKASYARTRSPSATLHPKRSWFLQKLHGQ